MKKPAHNFTKFAKKKSNAAIKEQFKQEKRKVKKEREDFFNEKRAAKKFDAAPGRPGPGRRKADNKDQVGQSQSISRPQSNELMPLNKFIAHAGICARRDAADMVKQ